MISCLVLLFLCPFLSLVKMVKTNFYALWAFLISFVVIIRIAIFSASLSSTLLANNSIDSTNRGKANGFFLTFGAFRRLIAQFVFGGLFSWSLRNIKGIEGNLHALGFPFNKYLIFFLSSLFSLLGALLTLQLPEFLSMNKIFLEAKALSKNILVTLVCCASTPCVDTACIVPGEIHLKWLPW